jgi:hypothetical protein
LSVSKERRVHQHHTNTLVDDVDRNIILRNEKRRDILIIIIIVKGTERVENKKRENNDAPAPAPS